jgi:hypothetical protein
VADLSISTRRKLANFVRLLASDRDGEVLAAARAIPRVLKAAGADIYALADQVEHDAKLSEAEMKKLYDAGYDTGRADGRARGRGEASPR